MAITHNLSTITDNLSGFDPVDGESDGTTIGRNYLLWQVFQGLKAFDSNVVMISSSGDTPTWLASQSGTIMTTPAKNASTANQTIKWFYLNDTGLSGIIPNAFVYEWGTTSDVASNNSLIGVGISHVFSGSAAYTYVLQNAGTITINDNGTAGAVANCMVAVGFGTATTTTMNLIPKIIYWKSSTSTLVMSINKVNAQYRGYLMWHNPNYTGYTGYQQSGSIVNGENFRHIVFNNAVNGYTHVEPFTKFFETSLTALGGVYLSNLSTAGLMPSKPFVIGVSDSILTSKVVLSHVSPKSKAVSETLEGIHITNDTASLYPYTASAIVDINSNYYLTCNTFNAMGTQYRLIVKLGT